jgi:hypothetical protein
MSTFASSPQPLPRVQAAKVPPVTRWRLRTSTCYTRAANSRKVAYVSVHLRPRGSIVDAVNESLVRNRTEGPEGLARVVMFGSLGDDASDGLLESGLRLFAFLPRYAVTGKRINAT